MSSRNKAMYSLYRTVPLKPKYKHLSIAQIETYPIKCQPGEIAKLTRDELYCWDKTKGRATKGFGSADSLNEFLNAELVRAQNIVYDLSKRRKPLTPETFLRAFRKSNVDQSLYEYCHEHWVVNRDASLSEETIKSYMSIIGKLNEYRPGIRMEEIDFKFLNQYANYMRKSIAQGGKGNGERTINNNMKIIRTAMMLAIKNDDFLMEHYPFRDYKVGETETELTTRDFLEPEEILQLENLLSKYYAPSKPVFEVSKEEWKERATKGILNPGEYKTLRYFLFACYCGLRYKDMFLLNVQEHIKAKWVQNSLTKERRYRYYIDVQAMHKTGRMLIVPLIDKATALLDLKVQGAAFPVMSNQKTNLHLKHIAKMAKIEKKLSFHVARHTFATTCFTYGIPAEVGQKLLGHKSEKFIKIYTHLTQNRLFHEMDKVDRGFNEHEMLMRVVHPRKQDGGVNSDQLVSVSNGELRRLIDVLSKMDEDRIAAIAKVIG
ncbi:MAG: site-specific integrase [Bacteroidia bacterium]|nr:site-specific integrase [Bacteroidia bacterium]